jgi:Glycosyl transferases group 1
MSTTRRFLTLRKELAAPWLVLWIWITSWRRARAHRRRATPKPPRRRDGRPDVLFVMERWCDCNPACGVTNSEHNLRGSLAATGLAGQRQFAYDRYVLRTGRRADVGLLREIARRPPSLLIVTVVPGASYHPSFACLWFIRHILRIPVVFIWFDFVDTGLVRTLALIYSLVSKTSVVLDAPHTVAASPLLSALYLPLWTPQDPRVFTPPDDQAPRDIDVCFLGSRVSYPDRLECLERLRQLPIRLVEGGGQREARLSVEEYVSLYKRSKIVVNFSANVIRLEADQAKGRVFEATLCGALLLESRNLETRHWLRHGEDYIEFTTAEDLVRKVQWFLAHDQDRRRIAKLGSLSAHSLCNAWRFWDLLLTATLRDYLPTCGSNRPEPARPRAIRSIHPAGDTPAEGGHHLPVATRTEPHAVPHGRGRRSA